VFVEGNKITRIQSAGTPGVPGRQGGAPAGVEHVVDAQGMYLLPGFIDMHVHAGGPPKNDEAEYAYKLWLAHGVTTVRGVPLAGHQFTVSERGRSEKNEIVVATNARVRGFVVYLNDAIVDLNKEFKVKHKLLTTDENTKTEEEVRFEGTKHRILEDTLQLAFYRQHGNIGEAYVTQVRIDL